MKQEINPFDYASQILSALPKGILLTTMANGNVDTMTIAWGSLGVDWGTPVFTAYVRSSRHSFKNLAINPQFTVNVPTGPFDRRILGIAGTKSGRHLDKIAALNLQLEPPLRISVPGIRQFPLTLECSVVYRQAQDPTQIPQEFINAYHPQEVDDIDAVANRYFHTAFYGAIVAAYIIQ